MTQSTDFARLPRCEQIRRLRGLAEAVLPRYGIEPASMSLLTYMHNTVFDARDREGARYALRILGTEGNPVHPKPTRARVASEVWWLDRLHPDLGDCVPSVVRTVDGEGVIEVSSPSVPGGRLCVLFGWLEGRFLRRQFAPVHLERVGRLTARLHEHSEHLAVPGHFDRHRVDPTDEETEEFVVRLFRDRWSRDGAAVAQRALRQARRAQEELGSGPNTFGVIHADIHQTNYLFKGDTARLIDFDDGGWGYYIHDLAVTLQQLGRLPHRGELRRALLAGYRQVRKLPAAQEATIDTFTMIRQLQDITWFLHEQEDPYTGDWRAQVLRGFRAVEEVLAAGE